MCVCVCVCSVCACLSHTLVALIHQNLPTHPHTHTITNPNQKQLGFPPQGTTGYYSANAGKADAAAVQAFLDGKGVSACVRGFLCFGG